MVARKQGAEIDAAPRRGPVARVLRTWRRLVTMALRWASDIAARATAAADRRGARWVERGWVPALGASAFVVGAAGTLAVAGGGNAQLVASVAIAESLVWAGMRWLVMRLLGRGPAARGRALAGAWALGLLPYAFAVVTALGVVAWVVSAGLTWFGLVSADDRPENAARTVGIAWGAQAAVIVLSRIASSGVVAFLSLR